MRINTARGGFTLIEMLVVLAILVVLMGMVGPRILGTQKKADIKTTKTQIGMLKASLERYALSMKDFPTTEQGLKAMLEKPEGAKNADKWDGPFLNASQIPKDAWGNDYQYAYPPERGKGDTPDIWSLGPDGEDNTEDDVTSWVK